MNNMILYNALRKVPDEAKKEISAGRLKGFTDINPMWRIKALTEAFGPCGIGWWYRIKDKRLEAYKDEIKAFVDIELCYRYGDEISQPVVGTGGASFVTMEKNGPYVSDECFKMALTDAIGVAAKSLGVGADVYYEKDRDKYSVPNDEKPDKPAPQTGEKETKQETTYECEYCHKAITKAEHDYSMNHYGHALCRGHQDMVKKQRANNG